MDGPIYEYEDQLQGGQVRLAEGEQAVWLSFEGAYNEILHLRMDENDVLLNADEWLALNRQGNAWFESRLQATDSDSVEAAS